jgi:uncharacterized Zn-binding protein involved in type VI secretion
MSLTVPQTSVRLTPAALPFAPQQLNTSSPPQTATLTNYGRSSLSITGISVDNGWAQTDDCGSSLAAGDSCTISVVFTPPAAASFTGSLTVRDSDPTNQQTIALSGTGTPAPITQISPTFLGFGSQEIGQSTAPMLITITDAGTVPLNFTSIRIDGTNAADYGQTNTCGSSIAAGASCTISVTFTPRAQGSRTATVSITDNARSPEQDISLGGTGSS